jgi:hypothetical protein
MKKVTFANCIIVVCVAVSGFITASVVWEYHRLDTVMPSGVVSALLGLWGGELLIVALRQIFGSDVTGKRKMEQDETSDESI